MPHLTDFHSGLHCHPAQQALKLITSNPSQHRDAAVWLLPLLFVVPVRYDRKLVKLACSSVAAACGNADPLGTATALLSDSFFTDDESVSWAACKEKVRGNRQQNCFVCVRRIGQVPSSFITSCICTHVCAVCCRQYTKNVSLRALPHIVGLFAAMCLSGLKSLDRLEFGSQFMGLSWLLASISPRCSAHVEIISRALIIAVPDMPSPDLSPRSCSCTGHPSSVPALGRAPHGPLHTQPGCAEGHGMPLRGPVVSPAW